MAVSTTQARTGRIHDGSTLAAREFLRGHTSALDTEHTPSGSTGCAACPHRAVCLPQGLDPAAGDEIEAMTRIKRKVPRGAAVYRNGDVFGALYAVRAGAFKTLRVTARGHEKVTGLHLPGEIMGCEAISDQRHTYDAIALEDSEVCVVPYPVLTQLALRTPVLQQRLLRMLSRDICRDSGLVLLMGGMTAEQRIAAFLLSLSRRHDFLGLSPSRFSLHMTREDIGSYLGLTLETVSRVLSRMQRDGIVAVRQRLLQLIDSARLEEMAKL
jgi:CRP/FNR family transcriptional regulator, anaerobic regulatory protein